MPSRIHRLTLFLSVLLGLVIASPAEAQTELELQAERQLEFSREELQKEEFERALASASAAFRLDPTLYDALVYKALAYEGLGELRLAEGLLNTYMDIRSGSETLPEGEAALERIVAKLGGATTSQDDPGTDVTGDASGDKDEPVEEAGADSEQPEGASEVEPAGAAEPEPVDEVASSEQNAESDSGENAEELESEDEESAVALVDMLPSDPLLAQLFLLQRRDMLTGQKNVGLGLMIGGLALAGTAGVLMGASAAEYSRLVSEGEVADQMTAVYGAGIGMLGSGITSLAVGLPLFVKSQQGLSEVKASEERLATRPSARLEARGLGLALSW